MRKILALSIASALLITGCASKESKLLGTWNMEASGKGAEAGTLELKADHKFAITGGASLAGTWKLEENKLSLTLETANGKSIAELSDLAKKFNAGAEQVAALSKPMSATVAEDLKSLSLVSPIGGTVTFKKSGS